MTPTKDANGDHVCEHGTAMDVHCCNCHSGFIFDKDHECPEPATSSPAPFDFVERLRLAQGQVRSSPLYRKFIDGTPLENDIAVWMTTFAAQAMRDYVQSASATALRACADALAPAPEWRCFHCEEVFTTEADAREHFGSTEMSTPGCAITVAEFRQMEQNLSDIRRENEEMSNDASMYHAQSHELERLFGKGVLSAHQAWLRWEEQESRAMAAEERLAALETSGADALAPPEPGWQPIATCPRDVEVIFWLVPKTAEESYTDTSGHPIVSTHAGYWKRGGWLSWAR